MPEITPLIPLMLDKPRHLRFDRQAVKTLERELSQVWGRDCTIYHVMRTFAECLLQDDLGKLSFTNLSLVLWQGCLHEDPTLTLATVEEALPYREPVDLLSYVLAVLQAWQVGTPPAPDAVVEDVKADPLDGSTGAPSGLLSGSASA